MNNYISRLISYSYLNKFCNYMKMQWTLLNLDSMSLNNLRAK